MPKEGVHINMNDFKVFYCNGEEMRTWDRVIVWSYSWKTATVQVVEPGTPDAANFYLPDGGFVIWFDSGDCWACRDTDEDIEKLLLLPYNVCKKSSEPS